MSDPVTERVDSTEEDLEVETTYKPPPEKSIEQILEADKEDESLRKYKETLLGEAKTGGVVVGEFDELSRDSWQMWRFFFNFFAMIHNMQTYL